MNTIIPTLRRLTFLWFISSFIFLASIAEAKTETYVIDPVHSAVEFHVRHFFSKVPGRFQKFEGTLLIDRENIEKSSVQAEIDIASIDTAQAKRDEHLRSKDFFDAAKYPKMTFQSKSWKKIGENEFEVTGDLTMHGVAKSVVLTVKSLGFGEGTKGSKISGWEAKTKIKRSDFGVSTGAPAVGDEVEIEINIESQLKAEPSK